jgi:hydrogenase maturation protease
MTSTPERGRLLVLGLGNVLCSDDGLGVMAVSALARGFEWPPDVEVLDGGTLGLALLPYLEEAGAVILVDAIRGDAAPGSFMRLEGADVAPAVEQRLSPHQVGVADLLDGARWLDSYPDRLVLLGLVPATIELGVGCSPAVQAVLPVLVDRLVEEIRGFGFDLVRRVAHEAAGVLDGADVAGVLGLHGSGRRLARSVSRDAGPRRTAPID